jgi:glycosyltransferase involved in cell wall biosynthesis
MKAIPKVSIITVCKNSANTIIKCIDSVVNQTYKNIEYIIIDGDSSDDTLKMIQSFGEQISKLISEPDNGIFDAMNKGIAESTGDYIIFLNADDYFISENSINYSLNFIVEETQSQYDIYYGKILIFENQSGIGSVSNTGEVSKFSIYRASLPHPATIYNKVAFNKCGVYDTTYKISSDYEWFVRAMVKHNLKFKRTNLILTVFNKGGVSTNIDHKKIIQEENEKIRKTYYSSWERKYYNFRWIVKRNSF